MKDQRDSDEALQTAEQRVTQLNEELLTAKKSLSTLQTQFTRRNEELTEGKQALTKLQQTITQQQRTHQEELQLVAENRMCLPCGRKADSYQQLSRYRRDCPQCIQKRKAKQNGKKNHAELFASS
jgi:hypothetical protein